VFLWGLLPEARGRSGAAAEKSAGKTTKKKQKKRFGASKRL